MEGLQTLGLKSLPSDARPREKLLARGPSALSDAELLALLLRTGIPGKHVVQLAQELLDRFGGMAGLLHTGHDALRQIKGLGPAKRAEMVAVLELARRALAHRLQQSPVFDSPKAVRDYLQLQLGGRHHEVFAVMFLDNQNRFAAPSPRPACTPVRWCCAPCTTIAPPWCWPTTTPVVQPSLHVPTKPSRPR
jgi:DNA repair protein RadC